MNRRSRGPGRRTPATRLLGSVLVAGLCAVTTSAQGRNDPASASSCRGAVESLESIDSWTHLYTAFKRFPRCADTATTEWWSEIVETLLSERWRTLPTLAHLARRDPLFESFVFQHIDELWNDGATEQLATRARRECPKGVDALCRKIEKRANGLLSQSAEPVH
jgi:hypothetical protein